MTQMQTMALRMPGQLSGGQQQRVALARAVVVRPKVLLLDEPFSALDAKLRETMQIEIRELQRELRITTLLVTHDQAEAMITADRVAVLNSGRVEQFDTPMRIYERPVTLFVADFVGRMNRLAGVVIETGQGPVRFRLDGSTGECAGMTGVPLGAGQRVTGVLRPERAYLRSSSAGSQNGISGKVKEVLFIGEKVAIHLETAYGVLIVHQQNRSRGADALPQPGASTILEWDSEDMLLFPEE
jgi:ABC-type Fe3+/spermidine/putrescine transport system ATPase subunit